MNFSARHALFAAVWILKSMCRMTCSCAVSNWPSQRLVIGPNLSATGRAMEANPGQAQQILANRREQHRGNMILNLQGIKRLVESGG